MTSDGVLQALYTEKLWIEERVNREFDRFSQKKEVEVVDLML